VYAELNQTARDRMLEIFGKYSHRPAQDQLKALTAIQECLTNMLQGEADRRYYLSSLDPGTGKTTAIVSWLKAYMSIFKESAPHGVLICVDRLDEIQRYVDDCSLPDNAYAVLAGKSEVQLNALGLGSTNTNKALVLFTTKEQIRRKGQTSDYEAIGVFQYKGTPRLIKVWDESLSIGKDIVINPFDFGRLFTLLATESEELVRILQRIMDDIMQCTTGDFYPIPILPELSRSFTESAAFKKSTDKDLIELLWRISGQPVTVRRYRNTQLIIDCVQSIPSDFPPCLVLDASGRIKGTYTVQKRKLSNLVELPYSNKSYRNLDVYVWRRGGGKEVIKALKDIAPELIKVLMAYPDEEFLFLLHKDHQEAIGGMLTQNLPPDTAHRVKFCTWGQATATNKYCNIRNIITMSAYQYPDPTYDAIARAAGLLTTKGGDFPTQEEIRMVKMGEISSNILQGVTRGAPRKSEGDTCPPCRLWLIAHPTTGLERELPTIFPDCVIREWKTLGYTLTKMQQRALDKVTALVAAGHTDIACADVRKTLGKSGMTPSNFKRILEAEPFKAALADLKIECIRRVTGLYFQVSN
jgi:hypothetical protein